MANPQFSPVRSARSPLIGNPTKILPSFCTETSSQICFPSLSRDLGFHTRRESRKNIKIHMQSSGDVRFIKQNTWAHMAMFDTSNYRYDARSANMGKMSSIVFALGLPHIKGMYRTCINLHDLHRSRLVEPLGPWPKLPQLLHTSLHSLVGKLLRISCGG